ncbi:MAG: type I-E CRISPR-associated protein Cse2/CasB [Ignavibacteriae bacterium]|nr:type I-E CRISPR-associated protein Cse2/CasB [Ignavibacteriota bacterium]MCB9216866.1 type I-E CRISPR-associated protein Cse2/CasB [Ignavibacteria bacterium]
MTEHQQSHGSSLLPPQQRAEYAHKALARLSEAWTRSTPNAPNYSGMRATFRRFKPDASGAPTTDMRQYIWGWIGSPFNLLEESDEEIEQQNAPSREATEETDQKQEITDEERKEKRKLEKIELEAIDQAAVVVAMRAVAGDHDSSMTIGEALYRSGMNDRRLMRFLTSGKDTRLSALHRALQLIDAKRQGINWTTKEVGTVLDFLYGSDRIAQRAGNKWASDFFRLRNSQKKEKKETPETE